VTEDLTSKSGTPASFVKPKPAKRTRKRTRNPAGTPGHQAAAAANSAMVPSSPDGVGHRAVPGICDHSDVAVKQRLGEPSLDPLGRAMQYMAGHAAKAVEQGGMLSSPANPQGAASMAAISDRGQPVNTVDYNDARVSESLGRDHGHASTSSGDHGPGQGRPGWVAYGHPGTPGTAGAVEVELNQSSTSVMPWMKRTESPMGFVGNAAFASPFSSTDQPPGADGGRVSARQLDTSMAGRFDGMQSVNASPGDGSRVYDSARQSATPPTPGHSLRDAESRAVSNKASKLDLMKELQRRIG
jgi:hypothetical protein